jgi:hypothetical protein
MRRPDTLACAQWLQQRLGAFLLTADHPGLPEDYAKLSLKKYNPTAARNDDVKVFRGLR